MSVDGGDRYVDVCPERLAQLYERHDGTVARVAEELGCSWTWAKRLLERHDIHEPEPHPATVLRQLDPEDLSLEGGDEA